MSGFDLLSIGDASFDVFIDPTKSDLLCTIDTKKCFISFSYGEKIPVKRLETSLGGNAANNAVGAKRLGIDVALVDALGDDINGEEIVAGLKREGVDCTYIIQQPSSRSNYSAIVTYGGERTIFTFHAPRTYEFPDSLPDVPWIYLTSMGETYKPFYARFLEWFYAKDAKLVFNPGSWQLKEGLAGIADILKVAYIVFVNREEAEKLTDFGVSMGKEKELLTKFFNLGPKVPVITDGPNGSFLYDGSSFLKIGIMPIDAYERTGAGDAFGSGFLSALIKGHDLGEALLWGTLNSASVIGYTGSQRGLLTEVEVETWKKMAESCGVRAEEF